MAKIMYSPISQNDLDEIETYISVNLSNSIAAEKIVDELLDTINLLETQPRMGTPLVFQNGLNSGYRYLVVKSYLVFYHVSEESVYIDRILYGKRDYMKLLFPEP